MLRTSIAKKPGRHLGFVAEGMLVFGGLLSVMRHPAMGNQWIKYLWVVTMPAFLIPSMGWYSILRERPLVLLASDSLEAF